MENREDGMDESTKKRVMYRSGVAARLSGVSVETLRVWERRYGLSDAARSEHGQRLYSEEQVRRLGLLKRLVDQGHAIGLLASLPIERLQELIGTPRASQAGIFSPIKLALVGETLSRRISAGGRDALELAIQRSCARLDDAVLQLKDAGADVLLVELSELDETVLPMIAAARDAAGATSVVVLYRFCASATIRALRMRGVLVARVPAELGELAMLCRAAVAGQRQPQEGRREPPSPRRFDEEALANLTASGNKLACECPRHLADLLLMVGSFERYSAQCASRNPADAQLHQELEHAAGEARAILEAAMERLARAEGLPLPASTVRDL
jgi:DNA-binding transcriptional MerR regulator